MIKNESVYPQLVAKTTSLWWLPTRNKPVVTKTVTRFSIFSINIQNTSFLSFFTFKQTHDALLVESLNFLSFQKVDSNQSETLKTTVPHFLDFHLLVSFRPNAIFYKTYMLSNIRVSRSFLLSILCCWVLVVGWKPFNLPEVRSITNGHFPICDCGWQLLWFKAADPGGVPGINGLPRN